MTRLILAALQAIHSLQYRTRKFLRAHCTTDHYTTALESLWGYSPLLLMLQQALSSTKVLNTLISPGQSHQILGNLQCLRPAAAPPRAARLMRRLGRSWNLLLMLTIPATSKRGKTINTEHPSTLAIH